MRQSLLALVALLAACEAVVNPDKIKPKLPADAFAFCDAARATLAGLQGFCLGAEYQWVFEDPGLPSCDNWGRAVALGNAKFDAAAAFDCLTALDQASCDDLLRVSLNEIPPVCRRAIQGSLTSQPCHDDVECAGGAYCDTAARQCPANCRLPATLDGDCASQRCAPGLACVNVSQAAVIMRCRNVQIAPASAACGILASGVAACTHGTACLAGTCTPQRTSGTCTAHDQCAPGYRCAGPPTAARSCQPAVPLTGPCTVGNQACALGTYCANGSCVLDPRASGTCGALSGETVDCTGSTCVVPAGTASGTCVAPFACAIP